MAYKSFRISSGLNNKAAADAIPDGSLQTCRYCAFDEIGTVTSGRGRAKTNNTNAVGSSGSLLGGFDGLINSLKYRFAKRGSGVFYGTISDATPLTDSLGTNVIESGTLAPVFVGATAPTFASTSLLSGFAYNGYAYMADGQGMGRFLYNGSSNVKMQAWGLRSPGYHTGDEQNDPLSSSSTTITMTLAGGHGLGSSGTMNVELVGLKQIGTTPDNEVNCLHYAHVETIAGNVAVTSSGGTLDGGGVTYTIHFQNDLANTGFPPINPVSPRQSGHAGLSGGSLSITTSQNGSDTQDEIQVMQYSGTVTAGYYALHVSNHLGTNEYTRDLAFNATAAQVQAALLEISFIGGGTSITTTAVTIDSATVFHFTVPTSAGTVAAAGGNVWFMRQGPTLTEGAVGALVAGKYYYAYTFYNGVAETNWSAQVPIEVATGASVALSNILLGPRGTTHRRIYRTDVDGRQLYQVGEIADNTTTTFTDTAKLAWGADHSAQPGDEVTDAENPSNAPDQQAHGKRAPKRGIKEAASVAKAKDEKLREKLATNLGLLSDWTDHDPPPTDLKEVGLLGDTVFGISGSALRFSQSGNPEHWPLSNSITPGKNTSETLRAWVGFDRDCIMYTSNALYRLTQVGLDFGDSRFEEIESPVGLASTRGVAALDGQQGHIFLAKSGLYLFDGARVNEISFTVEKLFTDPANADYINPAYMSSAVMLTSRDRMMLFYATTNAGNDRVLWGDFQDVQNPSFAVFTWAQTSAWREKSDNTILAGDSDGLLWQLDYGWADGGTGTMDWSVKTKEFALGDGAAFKLDELVLDANFAGASTTIVVSTRLRGNTRTATYTDSSNGRQRIKLKLPVSLWGEVVSTAISSSADTLRSLYAVGFTYSGMDEP